MAVRTQRAWICDDHFLRQIAPSRIAVVELRPQPNRDRVGALTALILIAYALIRIVTLPTLETELAVLRALVGLVEDAELVRLGEPTARGLGVTVVRVMIGIGWGSRHDESPRRPRSVRE